MPIAAGTRLGPYEIVGPIGAGGMGEVYRATDTRLRRSVAVKILPPAFIADRSRLSRFEQEARATAALRHPNVLTIHDYGTDGVPFLVTELLTGETLADVLARGPVPLRRAIAWSVQILKGMSAAHGAGIIHRDLKPANIFITTEGTVKVLDFGLAKMMEDGEALGDQPTLAHSEPGTVVGTIGYMSPEQVRGGPLDARSDIFSFAVVLYEMLTGKTPFARSSGAETMTAILRDDPPRLETPPHPEVLAGTITACLEKSPEARFHCANDLAKHLETLELVASGVTPAVVERSRSAPPQFQQLTFHRGNILQARFAPDGSIVYGASWDDRKPELFISHRGLPDSRPLGIGGSIHAVSRHGELAVSLGRHTEGGFQMLGTLARVPIAGGSPRPIANEIYEADWGPDGRQLAVARRSAHGYAIEYPIGRILYESRSWFSNLRVSPAGDRVAFLEHPRGSDNFGHVRMVDLTGQTERLSEDLFIAWGLAWHPGGEVWYTGATIRAGQGRTIMIYGVNMAGKSREVFSSLGNFFLQDIAGDGTVLVTAETFTRGIRGHVDGVVRDLSWFDWSFPTRLSEDGRTLLFEEHGIASGGVYAVYLRDTGGGPAIRLDEGQGRDLSHDGTTVLSLSNDVPEKLILIPTGAGEVRVIPVEGVQHFLTARYLPGEKEIVLIGSRDDQGSRLWRVNATGGEAHPISDQGITSWPYFAISPDGEWVTALGPDQLPAIYPVHGDEGARSIKGIRAKDVSVHWPDADHIFICEREEKRALIVEIDLNTGARRLVHTLTPPDPAGVQGVFPIYFSRDSKSYVFGYRVILSTLFVATGIQ